jgi:hypothetical protein
MKTTCQFDLSPAEPLEADEFVNIVFLYIINALIWQQNNPGNCFHVHITSPYLFLMTAEMQNYNASGDFINPVFLIVFFILTEPTENYTENIKMIQGGMSHFLMKFF